MLKGNRLGYIDACRGFAILLVILGHVVQYLYCSQSFDNNVIFRTIYSFHMPLFFFLSGFVSKRMNVSCYKFVGISVKRILQLLPPFCIWGIYLNKLSYSEPVYTFFIRPDHSLWFCFHLLLLILYCNFMLYLVQFLPRKGKEIDFLILVVGYVVLKFISIRNTSDLGYTSMLTYYYPYYACGILLGVYKDTIRNKKYIWIITMLSILCFLFLSSIWYRIPSAIPDDAQNYVNTFNHNLYYRYFTASTGIIASITLFSQFKSFGDYIIKLGQNSLGIYVIHQILLITFARHYVTICQDFCETGFGLCFNMIMLLFLSLLIINIVKRVRIIAIALIGDVDKITIERIMKIIPVKRTQ